MGKHEVLAGTTRPRQYRDTACLIQLHVYRYTFISYTNMYIVDLLLDMCNISGMECIRQIANIAILCILFTYV